MQITYKDKVTLQSNPNIPDENKVTAEDMNEIKSVVNSNEEEQQALKMSVQEIAQNVVNNSQEISNIKEEQTTQNNNISTLQNNVAQNNTEIEQIKTEQLTQNNNIQENTNDINSLKERVSTNETNIATLQTDAGHILELVLNNTTYVLTATLKNKAGTILSTSNVDFPVEQLVISVTYDSNTKELVITLKNGQVTRVPIGSIINGLVSQSDFDSLEDRVDDIESEQTTQNTNIQTNADNISALTSRVTETEEDISDIKEEQTEQNTNISTNATNIESLQEENENLKKIVAQMPQVTGQGTEVTLEDTIEAPFTEFDVEGNSTQETTEGYNMLDLDKYSYSESSSALNGGTVTIKDGVITLNATNATGNMTALSVTKLANADSIEAGTYYFGVDVYGAYESTPSTNIWEYRGNRTLTEKFIIKQWKYAVTQGNIGSTPILISNDTSKTTYEPYTGGQATPNPNYEQPIYSAGDNGSINEKIQHGNLFDKNKVLQNYELLSTDGKASAKPGWYVSDYMAVEENKSYYLSGNKTSGNANCFYDKDKNFISVVRALTNTEITAPQGAKYLRINGLLNELEDISIRLNEEQDYSISVQQPMRSIGDVRDCFVKKSDGWYERHKFEQVDLGTTDFRAVNNSEDSRTQGLFHTSISEIESNTNYSIVPNDILSNKYISGNAYKYLSPGRNPIDRTMSRYLKYIYIQNSDFSGYTNEQVKEAMAGTILQYPRETPLDLPCTQAQIEVLENMPSTYKEMTIINSEDETKAYLEVSGIRDINTMFDKVTNAIVSLGGNV